MFDIRACGLRTKKGGADVSDSREDGKAIFSLAIGIAFGCWQQSFGAFFFMWFMAAILIWELDRRGPQRP